MFSYFLFTLYRMSLTFPFFSQFTKLLILFLQMLNVSNLQNHDMDCCWTGFVPASSCICVQAYSHEVRAVWEWLQMWAWVREWPNYRKAYKGRAKGISCLCWTSRSGEQRRKTLQHSRHYLEATKLKKRTQAEIDSSLVWMQKSFPYLLSTRTVFGLL